MTPQWVIYQSQEWNRLLAQGYATIRTEMRRGKTWAYMEWQGPGGGQDAAA